MNRQLFINDYIQNPKQMVIPEKMTKKEERNGGKLINLWESISLQQQKYTVFNCRYNWI